MFWRLRIGRTHLQFHCIKEVNNVQKTRQQMGTSVKGVKMRRWSEYFVGQFKVSSDRVADVGC